MERPNENAEEQLVRFIRQLETAKLGWQAVHLRLSRLSPSNQRDYSIRIALNGLNDLVHRNEGRIFLFSNSDVVVLVKGAMVSEVNEAVFQVKFLFQDDALARAPHRLYGVLPAHERCSAGRWRSLAMAELRRAQCNGRLPIVVGGTGLYLKALMEGLAPVPENMGHTNV